MKTIFLFFVLFYCAANSIHSQEPTNAGIPDASTVLVVYRLPIDESDTLSQAIMEYYKNARGIPASNLVGLNLPRREISVGNWSDPHIVKLGYSDEYIQE